MNWVMRNTLTCWMKGPTVQATMRTFALEHVLRNYVHDSFFSDTELNENRHIEMVPIGPVAHPEPAIFLSLT